MPPTCPDQPCDCNPIAILKDPEKDIPLYERDIRLEDWLNDKIQTTADLSDLGKLIEAVDIQKKQLDQQLLDARAKLEATKKASADHAAHMLEQSDTFEKQHASIRDRIMMITSSDSPEEATDRLKGPMEKLRRVELATFYIELLKEVEELTVEARKHLPAEPKEALKPYTRLKELAITLRQLQEPAEGAAVHLVQYVEDTSTSLWLQMKKIMSDEFEGVLKKSNWPTVTEEPTREWIDCFDKLLDLQGPEIMAAREPLILLPFDVLAKPFVQEFKYHFFSDKATNAPPRLGDYFFEHFVGMVSKWEQFLRENVAPVLAAHFRGNVLAGNTLYVDPVSAFITALLPVLRQKVDSVLEGIGRDPRLLSKFIKQLLNFDDTVRDNFDYDGGNLELGWKGLTWDVLDTWFDRWINGEKDFALQRFRGIIKSPDTGIIDYDSTIPGKTRPTHGATRVADLVENVTKSYNKLRKFSHQMRFLIEIQAEILDQFQGRLSESLDAYQTITSTVARKLHGISREQQAELEGIRGIESLCKVYGSADYIINVLQEWSDLEFFINLWGKLQLRAKSTSTNDNLAGSMSYTEVKDSTSAAVGSESGGSVFDVTIEGYRRLRRRAEDLMIQALKTDVSNTLRHYLTRAQWTTVGDVPSVLAVTSELDRPIQVSREYLAFLQKTLSSSHCRHVVRNLMTHLQELLWNELLIKQDFTALGAAQLSRDLNEFERLNQTALSKLRQGVTLLNLPLTAQGEGAITLTEASNAIFATNAKADEVLMRLEMDQISRAEARTILARRVEGAE